MALPVLLDSDFVTNGTSSSVTISSFPISAGIDRVLTVHVGVEMNVSGGSSLPSTITIDGVNLVMVTSANTAGTGFVNSSSIWQLLDSSLPSVGNYDIIATLPVGSGVGNSIMSAATFSGVDQATPSGAQVNSDFDTNATIISSDITTTSATDHVIVSGASSGVNGAFSATPISFTVVNDSSAGSSQAAYCYYPNALASTLIAVDYTRSSSTNRLACTAVSYAAPSGGGSTYEEDLIFNAIPALLSTNNIEAGASLSHNSIPSISTLNNVSISSEIGLFAQSVVNNQTSITFDTILSLVGNGGTSFVSNLAMNNTIELTANTEINMQNIANMFSQSILSSSADIITSLGNLISEAISLNSNASLSNTISMSLSGDISLGSTSGLISVNNVNLEAAANIGAASSMAIVTSAILSAGLDLSAISSVQVNGSVLVIGVTTPGKRTVTVEVSSREFKISTTDRITEVKATNRIYKIDE